MTRPRPKAPLPPLAAALLAQAGGWGIVFLIAQAVPFPAGWAVVLAQGGAAAGIAWLLKSPWWWLAIHLIFFPAILAAQRLDLPSYAYLAALVLLWLLFRNAVGAQVPLYLSNAQAVEAIAAQLPTDRPFRFLDLGSGTGALLRPLAKRFPHGTFVGIESAPAPRWWATWQAGGLPNLAYWADDFFAEPWGEYDFLYAFLSPAPMGRIERKARVELKKEAVLISNTFPLPSATPFRVDPLDPTGRRTLYWYRFPQ